MSARRGQRPFKKFNQPWKSRDRNFSGPKDLNYNRSHQQDKYSRCIAQQKLSENEVAITEYISTVAGFSGVIKARFSDFHVNEINNDGEIAKLTITNVPECFKIDNDHNDDVNKETDLISKEIWEQLKQMVDSSEESKVIEVDVSSMNKEDRTIIHESIKKVFGEKIMANTRLVGDKKVLEFKKYLKGDKTRADRRVKWPKDLGEYVYFLVYKEVVDTIGASFKLSDCLRMKSSNFSYAGVKDRRAKTTQWFCVKKVDPQQLLRKTKFLRNIHVGNFAFKNKPLKLGQLKGNRFRIALRNVTADDAVINEAMESLNNKGFINYYGLQRFGNDKEVPTFEVGIKLLQGNWKEACDLILKPKACDDPRSDITQAKRIYKETKNASLASKEFSRNFNKCIESKLLQGLTKNHENDYVTALENIPRSMRLLYIHSFQSLVWNKITSRRIKEFGLKPIVGDIVLLSEETVESKSTDDSVDEEINGGHETETPKTIDCDAQEESVEVSLITHQETKILAESDLENYTIYDVVLPLPGYDVKYPENEIKTWYNEILQEYGLTTEMQKQKVKTYNLSGTYRKIIGQVKDLSWKTVKYHHPNDTLIISDYEELTGDTEAIDDPSGQYKALIIDFCLSSSCYATMVLREILKIDTSTVAHAKLNKYHKELETIEGCSKKEVDVPFAGTNSLLSDATNYEAFKQQIFGITDDASKRKADEESEEGALAKKAKTASEKPESSIQLQPSFV